MFQSAAGSITFHPPLDAPGPSRSYRQSFRSFRCACHR